MDKIRKEHINATKRLVQASKKITEKRLKWYGHARRMKEEHIEDGQTQDGKVHARET